VPSLCNPGSSFYHLFGIATYVISQISNLGKPFPEVMLLVNFFELIPNIASQLFCVKEVFCDVLSVSSDLQLNTFENCFGL
jgi:hypothetical protein